MLFQASDGVGSSTTEVRISVRDANNHSPQFSKDLYLAAVQETAAVGRKHYTKSYKLINMV